MTQVLQRAGLDVTVKVEHVDAPLLVRLRVLAARLGLLLAGLELRLACLLTEHQLAQLLVHTLETVIQTTDLQRPLCPLATAPAGRDQHDERTNNQQHRQRLGEEKDILIKPFHCALHPVQIACVGAQAYSNALSMGGAGAGKIQTLV